MVGIYFVSITLIWPFTVWLGGVRVKDQISFCTEVLFVFTVLKFSLQRKCDQYWPNDGMEIYGSVSCQTAPSHSASFFPNFSNPQHSKSFYFFIFFLEECVEFLLVVGIHFVSITLIWPFTVWLGGVKHQISCCTEVWFVFTLIRNRMRPRFVFTVLKFSLQRKCDQYWPNDGMEIYGSMSVKLLSTVQRAHYTVNIFSLRNMKVKKVCMPSALLRLRLVLCSCCTRGGVQFVDNGFSCVCFGCG